ncbi:MAG: hypothetical protein U0414_17535 [Polyangiaceae bacterium]
MRRSRSSSLLNVVLSSVLLGAAAFAGCASGPELARNAEPTSSASAAPSTPASTFDAPRFAASKPAYMKSLGESSPDATTVAIRMEAEMLPYVDAALRVDAASPAATKEEAGLALVYGALVLTRDLQGILGGRVDSAKLFAAHPYASASDVDAEIAARRDRAVKLLEAASTLRPNDGRVASWLAAAKALAGTTKELSPEAKKKVLAAVDVQPTFNLWTAYIVLRHEPIDSPIADELFQRTQAFLSAKQCRDVAPGSREERDCKSGPLAPFNTQAAVVMLGDQYLRRGEAALGKGDIPKAMPLLGTARGIYATLADDANQAATAKWRDRGALDVRLKRLDALKPGAPAPDASFWGSPEFDAVYECASCHAE